MHATCSQLHSKTQEPPLGSINIYEGQSHAYSPKYAHLRSATPELTPVLRMHHINHAYTPKLSSKRSGGWLQEVEDAA